jgi:hypothetical protein
MKYLTRCFVFLLAGMSALGASKASAQSPVGTETPIPPKPKVATLVNTVTIMPYITASLNLFSGKAFPANATGIGYGGGLAFDLTDPGQRVGFLFDFAFQDMRASAQNGNCITGINNATNTDSLLGPANAYHYWRYILFEPFLKFQGAKKNGYFLIGASLGFAVLSETESRGITSTEYVLWDGTPFGNQFRLDIRAGLGVELAKIGTHELILEARAGYPVTNVISNFQNACTGGEIGSWRIITVQANLGLRV